MLLSLIWPVTMLNSLVKAARWLFATSMLLLVSLEVQAGATIDGIWRLADEPVWIEIESGQGLVVRHDKNPDALGKTTLRNLVAGDEPNSWQGEIYVPQLSSYKDVSVVLSSADAMDIRVKVGFFRKLVKWQRDSLFTATEGS